MCDWENLAPVLSSLVPTVFRKARNLYRKYFENGHKTPQTSTENLSSMSVRAEFRGDPSIVVAITSQSNIKRGMIICAGLAHIENPGSIMKFLFSCCAGSELCNFRPWRTCSLTLCQSSIPLTLDSLQQLLYADPPAAEI